MKWKVACLILPVFLYSSLRFGGHRSLTEETAIFTTDRDGVPPQLLGFGKLHVFGTFASDHRAVVIPTFDTTFDGKPLFGSMLRETELRARNFKYVVWTNSDIFLPRLSQVLERLAKLDYPWFAVATRWDFGKNYERFHSKGGVDVFIWNRPDVPTVRHPYPPFVRTSNQWDNWWVTEVATFRTIINVTTLLHASHRDHNGTDWSQGATSWHNFHNRHTAVAYQRGYTYGLGVRAPNVLTTGGVEVDSQSHSRVATYATKRMKFFTLFSSPRQSHQGHQLTDLLDHRSNFILTGGNRGFVPFIMNFVCNCRRLGLDLLVVAFDKEAFEFLYMHGVAVFLAPAELTSGVNENAQTYGTTAYKKLTKVKTAVVRHVLETAAHPIQVAWIDPDVIVYKPIKFETFPGDFYVQNNNPTHKDATETKTNSGVYVVRNAVWVISALAAIERHAKTTQTSEQMSWNAVLCSESATVAGPCIWDKHPIFMLDRNQFATGHPSDVATAGVLQRRFTGTLWHNNWVTLANKEPRAVKAGASFWDARLGVCRYD